MNLINDLELVLFYFLTPRDLLEYRCLTKNKNKIITNFLKKTSHTTRLLLLICPMCGNDWINTEKISSDLTFKDIDDKDSTVERVLYIEQKFPEDETFRKHLFCKECEDYCDDYHIPFFTKQTFMSHFVLRNFCNYVLHVDYYHDSPWTFITSETKEGLAWNQYNYDKFVEIIYDQIEYDEHDHDDYDDI